MQHDFKVNKHREEPQISFFDEKVRKQVKRYGKDVEIRHRRYAAAVEQPEQRDMYDQKTRGQDIAETDYPAPV